MSDSSTNSPSITAPVTGWATHLFSAAISLVLFGLLTSTARVWQSNGPLLIPSGSYTLLPALVLLGLALFIRRRSPQRLSLSPEGFSLGLLLLFVSDWFDRSYNFFPNPSVRGEILLGALIFALLPARFRYKTIIAALPLSILLLAGVFLSESQGRLLFSDDHPSFLLRLALLREQFPKIPFYYPFWNAGLDARDFFATGSLGVFLLFSPVIYLAGLSNLLAGPLYNILVATLLFVVVPMSTFWAARFEGLKPIGQVTSGILSLCLGLVWYRWALKYGTMGFVLAAALTPLNFSLALSLLDLELRKPWRKALLFVVTSSLMLFWSPSGLVFVPVILTALVVVARRVLAGHRKPLATPTLVAGALLIAINIPWMSLFWSVSNVGRFLESSSATPTTASYSQAAAPADTAPLSSASLDAPSREVPAANAHRGTRHREGKIDLQKSMSLIREKAFSTNPLLIFLAIPGFLLLRKRSMYTLLTTSAWLIFLGAILVPLKPQLELDRMLVVLSMLLCLPAGAAASELLSSQRQGAWVKALVAGFLFASPLCTAAVLSNRTVDQYHFAGPLVRNLANAIKDLGGAGRTVFAGCIVHELEEGHIAPLTLMSGKELVASAPFHTLWRYTQVIPKSFMERGDAGIEDFFILMNATSVVAHEREWRDYFSARPEQYRLAWREDRFSLFERVLAVDQPFASGSGTLVERRTAGLEVRVASESAVLKYNYFPFLEAQGCEIFPAQVAPELQFIGLRNCPKDTDILIEAGSPLKRLGAP